MKTTKNFWNDKPAAGTALLNRHISRFSRTKNGAWVGAGASEETFEIPLSTLNSEQGAEWLNPGRCGHVSLRFEDGTFLSVDGGNDPIQGSGFGPLGILQGHNAWGEPLEVFCSQSHPLLPNLFKCYYRVVYYTPDVATTFEPTRDYQINYLNAAGNVVDTLKTGPFGVTRGFAEHVAKSGLISRPSAASFEVSQA